ncbi:MAG: hypothetical protein KDD22_03920 [Bdellovibrionales bacterium]|nr:hypothetical protein [Bdellovibrionales bacterium]
MNLEPVYYFCFCCGWTKLDFKPYANCPSIPVDTSHLTPPYRKHWGAPSYGVCPCCGYEFGNDDEPERDVPGISFEQARSEWIHEENAQWLDSDKKPKNWDLEKQIKVFV